MRSECSYCSQKNINSDADANSMGNDAQIGTAEMAKIGKIGLIPMGGPGRQG